MTFVKVFCCTHTEASSRSHAGLRHACICKALPRLMLLFFFSSPCKVSTWKRKIVWKPFAWRGLHAGKPHRAELCKNVWCRFRTWAYATFCSGETICTLGFFPLSKLLLWPWGGRAGQGQQLSARLEALWHVWPGRKCTRSAQTHSKQAAPMTDFTLCYRVHNAGLRLIQPLWHQQWHRCRSYADNDCFE